MSFDSVDVPIADVVSRFTDPTDRAQIELLLKAADQGDGGEDGRTSETEAGDFLERNPALVASAPHPALPEAMAFLRSVGPPPERRPQARAYQHVRADLARITRELEPLQTTGNVGPTPAQDKAIKKLSGELGHAVSMARELAKQPQFATIAGYANAAIIRVASYRSTGMFTDSAFATPPQVKPSKEAAIACARLELAAVNDVARQLGEASAAFTVMPGMSPPQATELVADLHDIRFSLEALQAKDGSTPREVAAINAEFNQTLRLVAGTTYNTRTPNTSVKVGKFAEADLPQPLVVAP